MKIPKFNTGSGWSLCMGCNKWEKTMAFPWEGKNVVFCEWAYYDLVESQEVLPKDFQQWTATSYPLLDKLHRQKPS